MSLGANCHGNWRPVVFEKVFFEKEEPRERSRAILCRPASTAIRAPLGFNAAQLHYSAGHLVRCELSSFYGIRCNKLKSAERQHISLATVSHASAFADLTAADSAWWQQWQENGARDTSDSDKWLPSPGQSLVTSGRSLNRANSRALFSYAPALIANSRLSEDDERNATAIAVALQEWATTSPPFSGSELKLSPANKQRLASVTPLLTIEEDGKFIPPDAAIIPSAAAQGFPANPVFLPAPHEVATALFTAFSTPPTTRSRPMVA